MAGVASLPLAKRAGLDKPFSSSPEKGEEGSKREIGARDGVCRANR
jgi:hypothetical protein